MFRTGPRTSGIWSLSKERFGFAADRRADGASGSHPRALRRARGQLILLDTVIDVPSTEFEYDGEVSRTIGGKPAVYLRIRFRDGSGIDIHNR